MNARDGYSTLSKMEVVRNSDPEKQQVNSISASSLETETYQATNIEDANRSGSDLYLSPQADLYLLH